MSNTLEPHQSFDLNNNGLIDKNKNNNGFQDLLKPDNNDYSTDIPQQPTTKLQNGAQAAKTRKTSILQRIMRELSSKPESDEKIKLPSQFSFGVLIVKIFVILFDIITFPIYYFVQKPWIKMEKSKLPRAKLENPKDPYSAYKRVKRLANDHYMFKAQTIPETQQLQVKLNPQNFPILGRRQIVDVVTEISAKGKRFMKYKMTDYEWFTVGQVDKIIGDLSRGLLKEGVRYQEKVLIFSETRMEWFLFAQALLRIGATITTLYATLGLKSICHGIKETEVEHIITTSDLLPLLLKIIQDIDKVKKIYVIEVHPGLIRLDPLKQNDFNEAIQKQIGRQQIKMVTYDQLIKIGQDNMDLEYTRPTPDDVAVILYTSGSTGNPKGVVLTHKNFIATMHSIYSVLSETLNNEFEKHIFYGVLPLAHAYEIAIEMTFFALGLRIGYGTPYTMTDNSTAIIPGHRGDLKLLKPTVIAGVPLLLDRIRRTITDRFERKKSVFWKQLVKFFVAYKMYWIDRGFDTPLVNKFICSRLNGNLGGKLRYIISGGAPLSPETHRMMKAFLNVQIAVGYGATETCAASCMMDLDDLSIGRIGSPLGDVKVRLVDWPEGGYSVHDKPYPRGELVLGGETIAKEYFKLPDKTAESFEEKDGTWWFKMGDIGEVNELGTFKIIDRKKDLVKLQFGEYISLGKVEAELKNFSFIENIMIYGDSMHTYMIALIAPNRPVLKRLAEELGKSHLSFEQMCEDKEILTKIMIELKQFCLEAGLHKMETPQKIKLCTEEWSLNSGFLTASMKIKRRILQQHYQKTIDELYGR